MEPRGDTARSLPPGTRLGRYTVVKRIGVGGMAELYLAQADVLGARKLVALKIVHAHLSGDAKLAELLRREARVAATLEHPNIVSVIDVGEHRGETYLVMEYVHGRDVRAIQEALPPGEPAPLAAALEIVRNACRGLHYAHTRHDADGQPLGIIHRDVSPSNILVSYGGAVSLVDFGIAKVGHGSTTTQGVLKGKFGYMSPEQSMGLALDARSDVFALGVVLYELTTGRRAFVGHNPYAVMNRAIRSQYVHPRDIDPRFPPGLARIIERTLKADPTERYASVAAVLTELDAFALEEKLKLGEEPLRELMAELFGAPEPPLSGVDLVSGESSATLPSGPTATRTTTRRQARVWPQRVALLCVVMATAGAGWWAGATQAARPFALSQGLQADGTASPSSSAENTAPAEVAPAFAPSSSKASSKSPPASDADVGQHVGEDVDPSVDVGQRQDDTVGDPRELERSPTVAKRKKTSTASKRRSAKRRDAKASRPTAAPAKPRRLDGMLPPSMQP